MGSQSKQENQNLDEPDALGPLNAKTNMVISIL